MRFVFFWLLYLLTLSVAAPVAITKQAPVAIQVLSDGTILVDFGKVAFGNLSLFKAGANQKVVVHFGEAFAENRINRKPPGTVRYAQVSKLLVAKETLIEPEKDQRNSSGAAILTEKKFGTLLPFRWVEIEGWSGPFTNENICRNAVFAANWHDDDSLFVSSDETLNRVYELCKYSMKATTFAGVFVDGDRERIPYEADAYLNQISGYAVNRDLQMSRDTFAHLMKNPTWPSEWAPHMVLIAYADWLHSADKIWLSKVYQDLKKKTLSERPRQNGLLVSNQQQITHDDIVDWPSGERDGFQFTKINSVVNAFHLRSLKCMAEIAAALGKSNDASDYEKQYASGLVAFNEQLLDQERGLYRDGVAVNHYSQHANFFPLAFQLVPENKKASVLQYLKSSGMKCSVYGAQYLLEALLENGEAQVALNLIVANNDRSWWNMLEKGTTITYEAWDQKYKPNQDWNHAWGAAPANLLPRYIAGIRPLKPGWAHVLLQPQPANLKQLKAKIPTPRGYISVQWQHDTNFNYQFELPKDVMARIELPKIFTATKVFLDGKEISYLEKEHRLVLSPTFSGKHTITLQQ